MLAPAKSDPARNVERAVLGPLLDRKMRYWDLVKARSIKFLELSGTFLLQATHALLLGY